MEAAQDDDRFAGVEPGNDEGRRYRLMRYRPSPLATSLNPADRVLAFVAFFTCTSVKPSPFSNSCSRDTEVS